MRGRKSQNWGVTLPHLAAVICVHQTMPSLFFYILCRVGAFVPFGRLQQWGRPPLFLPFYHLVSDENPSHVRYLYPVRTVRQFRDDLDFFLKNYQPVPLEALWPLAENPAQQPSGRPAMHLSFDDGLRECHDVVMPILLEKGVPATFFLNPDIVDNRDLMFRYKASLLHEAGACQPIRPLSVVRAVECARVPIACCETGRVEPRDWPIASS